MALPETPLMMSYEMWEDSSNADVEVHLIPAPTLSINKVTQTTEAGHALGVTYQIQLTGKIVVNLGSPDASVDPIVEASMLGDSDNDWYHNSNYTTQSEPGQNIDPEDRIVSMIKKQQRILTLFNKRNTGKELKVWWPDKATPASTDWAMKIIPDKIGEVQFENNALHTMCNYTVTLEANRIYTQTGGSEVLMDDGELIGDDDSLYYDGVSYPTTLYIESAGESVDIQPEVKGIDSSNEIKYRFIVTHSITAKGKPVHSGDSVSAAAATATNPQNPRGQLTDTPEGGTNALCTVEPWQWAKIYFEKRKANFQASGGNLSDKTAYDRYWCYCVNTMLRGNVNTTNTDYSNQPVIGLDSASGYNEVTKSVVDEGNGSYTLTSTYIIADEGLQADETRSITISESNRSNLLEGRTNINISGVITGLSITSDPNERWSNAWSYFEIVEALFHSHAEQDINKTNFLHLKPISTTLTMNKAEGTISYNYNYNNRPAGCDSNELTRNVRISDSLPGQVIAEIPVLGRPEGPVLQDIGTFTSRKRNLTIEIEREPISYPNTLCDAAQLQKPTSIDVDSFKPSPASKVYKVRDVENWDPVAGQYSRNVQWTYEE